MRSWQCRFWQFFLSFFLFRQNPAARRHASITRPVRQNLGVPCMMRCNHRRGVPVNGRLASLGNPAPWSRRLGPLSASPSVLPAYLPTIFILSFSVWRIACHATWQTLADRCGFTDYQGKRIQKKDERSRLTPSPHLVEKYIDGNPPDMWRGTWIPPSLGSSHHSFLRLLAFYIRPPGPSCYQTCHLVAADLPAICCAEQPLTTNTSHRFQDE